MTAPQRIFLVGFSFTGKTEAGRLAAQRLGWAFVDTDHMIVAREGKSIADIFAPRDGEARFRELERQALTEAVARERVVVSTGGGAVTDPRNRELMRSKGVVVCLEAQPETILARLRASERRASGPVRPLLAAPDPLQQIRSLKEQRQASYAAAADWTAHTDNLTAGEVATEVLRGYDAGKRRFAPPAAHDGPTCEVRTATEVCPIYVGWGALDDLGRRMRDAGLSGTAYVISDESVLARYGERALASLRGVGFTADSMAVPPGEPSKSLEMAGRIYDWLVAHRAERGHAIVALGGGVVGDLAGFVAATFLRGVPFVQAPTSLLAMVDASVGGKVAVNHREAKNSIGAFYQPRLVLADVSTLSTLPLRELTSGWAEVIKHGAILDAELFALFEEKADALKALEPRLAADIIGRSVAIKARVASEDEKETTGLRTLLNYGHTIGHALEAATSYEGYLHGEAVAVGMVGAALISQRMGLLTPDAVERLRKLLQRFGLPVAAPGVSRSAVLHAMALDKKVEGKAIKWVVLEGIGRATVRRDVPEAHMLAALEALGVR